jgi:hypothetical protein
VDSSEGSGQEVSLCLAQPYLRRPQTKRAESYARFRFAEPLTGEDPCNGAGTGAWLKPTGFQGARFAAA